MADDLTLPEEMILLILSRLPIKSLIQFACVSKHFHSVILSNPKFAKSHFQIGLTLKTLTQRLLYTPLGNHLESLHLHPSKPGFSVRTHILPPAVPPHDGVTPLGSSNGIVFLGFDDRVSCAWNPSTGFFQKLPECGFSPDQNDDEKRVLSVFGVGYLPATDDYRVFLVSTDHFNKDNELVLFSSKAKAWKRLEANYDEFCFCTRQGFLAKEALHWLDEEKKIVAFDLGQDENHEFREMSVPRDYNDDEGEQYVNHLGVAAGGKLCLARSPFINGDCVDIWVMREYGVHASWAKNYSLKFSCPPRQHWSYNNVLILESCIIAEIYVHGRYDIGRGLVKIGKEEWDTFTMYKTHGNWLDMIQYEETLLQIDN